MTTQQQQPGRRQMAQFNSETHNRIIEIGDRIANNAKDLQHLSAPPTANTMRVIIGQLRRFTLQLERTLEQPERLRGCKCALPGYEDHAGTCSGADCYCH